MGWVPQEEFRGAAENWRSAEEFVEKGEAIMPILQANNRKLSEQLRQNAEETAELKRLFGEAQKTIESLDGAYTDIVKQRVAQTRKDLMEQLKTARADDDVETEVRVQSELVKLETANARKTEEAPPKEEVKQVDYTKDPDFVEFLETNPWYSKDIRKTAYANGVATELRQNEGLMGKALLKRVAEETNKMFDRDPPAGDKVEGDSSTSRKAPSGGKKKSYEALPADAKAACEMQASMLVGPGKRHKDLASWRAKYAEIYFAGEE